MSRSVTASALEFGVIGMAPTRAVGSPRSRIIWATKTNTEDWKFVILEIVVAGPAAKNLGWNGNLERMIAIQ